MTLFFSTITNTNATVEINDFVPPGQSNEPLAIATAPLYLGLVLVDTTFERFDIHSKILPGLLLLTSANALIATYTIVGWSVTNWGLFETALTAADAAGLLKDTIKKIFYDPTSKKITSYITNSSQECILHPSGTSWTCKWDNRIDF